MAKYYVQSGPLLKVTINADSGEEAAIKAVRIGAKRQVHIPSSIMVSQQGFDFFDESVKREDEFFYTAHILSKAGFEDGQVL
jgi:hypothetical protein